MHLKAFPCEGNPLENFLNQPPLSVNNSAHVVDVYTTEAELTRTWLAVEALIRLNRFKINLHLSPDTSLKTFMRFIPQVKRGVNLLPDNSSKKSFYHSQFLNHVVDKHVYPEFAWNHAVSACNHPRPHLVHRAYAYNKSWNKELINPLRINFFHSVDEPLFNVYVDKKIFQRFSEYTKRISMVFDLVFFHKALGENTRIIPGYMQAWIDPCELKKEKEYSISFLLSMANNGIEYNQAGTEYALRASIWNAEKSLGKPTRFYVSKRNISKFPAEYQSRVLPTDSKKPVFDSQFNIAIENCRQVNYMTEKLLGCFVSLTIPIYLGCPNVRDYFDAKGKFIAETGDDIISID